MGPRLSRVLSLCLLLPVLACGGETPSSSTEPSSPPRDVETLLREMTLDEKVGQMAQADRSYLAREGDIRDFFLGSVAATGLDWTFSPCVAVARDERWGRTYESFGETPELVSEMAAAAVRGYQPTTAQVPVNWGDAAYDPLYPYGHGLTY